MSSAGTATLLAPYRGGAIAVIRIRGSNAWPICTRHLRTGETPFPTRSSPSRIYYGHWQNGGTRIDDVLVCARCADGPDDVVDVSVHGGVRVVQRVLMSLEHAGVRIVERDQESHSSWRPADRVQSEADRLLVRAPTRRAVRFLSRQRERLPDELRRLADRAEQAPQDVRQALSALRDRTKAGRLLVDGIRLVVVGPVNAGKSRLANRLLGRTRSLVSDIAGTTRDVVSERGALCGVPITVVDTPGLRPSGDVLECESIRRASPLVAGADLVLVVLDRSEPWPRRFVTDEVPRLPDKPTLVVLSKLDLGDRWEWPHETWPRLEVKGVGVSAMTGEGIDSLSLSILDTLGLDATADPEIAPFTERQEGAIDELLSDQSADPAALREGIMQLLGGSWVENSGIGLV
ncbi:MAG: 50S ribosome-binding GTPase [Planctomycetes bacterium]|nr:50S ribosome-binding GTPase [Planctomycetota bacterium]